MEEKSFVRKLTRDGPVHRVAIPSQFSKIFENVGVVRIHLIEKKVIIEPIQGTREVI